MPELVTVKSSGKIRQGWVSASIFSSIDDMAIAFEIGMTDKPDANGVPRKAVDLEEYEELYANAQVQVLASNDLLLEGYIDDYTPSYDASSASVFWSGRNYAGDLVDSAPGFKGQQSKQFIKQTILVIAKELAKPFGLNVSVADGVDIGEPITVTIDAGETVGAFLERLARYRAVIFNSKPNGDLVIIKPGYARAAAQLVYGKNILSASGNFTIRDLYSSYTVVSQINDTDSLISPLQSAAQHGIAKEPMLGERFRHRVIVSDKAADSKACQTLAKWEQRTRNGRARTTIYRVNGWRENPADLSSDNWVPGKLIYVEDPKLKISSDRLITAVQLVQDDSSQYAELSVAPLSAYDLKEEEQATDEKNIKALLLANAAAGAS